MGACKPQDGSQPLERPEAELHPLAAELDALGPAGAFRWLTWPPHRFVVLLHPCGLHIVADRRFIEAALDDPDTCAQIAGALARGVVDGKTGEHTVQIKLDFEAGSSSVHLETAPHVG